ncbi:MAG: endonuclease domain-containing protein [Ghiorsea sp.]|nr:endonuclease domain-containing protein [Ghiorsea sp.]
MNDDEQQHPDRFAPTPLARGESQTPVSLENSPSSLKGWQPEADGVDATSNNISPSKTTLHPLTKEELKAPATQHSPSSLKGWQPEADGVDATGKKDIYHINQHIILKKFTANLPRNPRLRDKAKALRKAGVLSEVLFWQQVHHKKFYSIDFDRQCIIGNYIVDFYVPSLSLVIEIDGQSHDHKGAYDEQRLPFLISLGLHVYRLQDGDVKHDLSDVMLRLEDFIIQTYAIDRPHPARFEPTSLTREESQTNANLENSPSPVKGWTRSGRDIPKKSTTP